METAEATEAETETRMKRHADADTETEAASQRETDKQAGRDGDRERVRFTGEMVMLVRLTFALGFQPIKKCGSGLVFPFGNFGEIHPSFNPRSILEQHPCSQLPRQESWFKNTNVTKRDTIYSRLGQRRQGTAATDITITNIVHVYAYMYMCILYIYIYIYIMFVIISA